MDKQQLQERQQKILELIQGFCEKHLDDEYLELSERLLQKLGRKRTQPLAIGQLQIWAASIIHALGSINFLFDKSSEPYTTIDDLNAYFGTSKTTTGSKSKQIRDLFKLDRWDNEFSTQRMAEINPFAKFVMVDGLVVSVNSLPEHLQIIVKQARAEGRDVSFKTH